MALVQIYLKIKERNSTWIFPKSNNTKLTFSIASRPQKIVKWWFRSQKVWDNHLHLEMQMKGLRAYNRHFWNIYWKKMTIKPRFLNNLLWPLWWAKATKILPQTLRLETKVHLEDTTKRKAMKTHLITVRMKL